MVGTDTRGGNREDERDSGQAGGRRPVRSSAQGYTYSTLYQVMQEMVLWGRGAQ